MNGLERVAVALAPGELQVEPGVQCASAGFAPAGGHPVVVGQEADGEVVRHHHTVEPQLVTEQVVEDRPAPRAREAVDRRVGVHDRGQARVADGGGEGLRVDLAKLAWAELYGGMVLPALRHGVPEEVLARADDPLAQVLGLQASDVGRAHASRQVRVLAVRLLHPPPAGIPGDVEDGRQRVTGADCQHLAADDAGHFGHQRLVPRRCQADGLRELGGIPRAIARHAFFVDHDRDPQARPFDHDALDLVHEPGAPRRSQTGRRADTRHVADAVLELPGDVRGVESVPVHEIGQPDAADLRQLLLEVHAPEQVLDALVERSIGVPEQLRPCHRPTVVMEDLSVLRGRSSRAPSLTIRCRTRTVTRAEMAPELGVAIGGSNKN